MGSEVKAHMINSDCYDSPYNSTYCDVTIVADEPFTDFEIYMGIIDNIQSVNPLVPEAKIQQTGNELIIRYNQSVAPLNKIVYRAGAPFVTVRYEIFDDFLERNWPSRYPAIENVATYIQHANIVTLAPNSDGSAIETYQNAPFSLVIPFRKYADVDQDGYSDRNDIFLLKNYLRNKDINTILSERALAFLRADVNYDHQINEDDLESIYTYIYKNPSKKFSYNPLPNQTIILYGDANLDGDVDEEDVILILNHASGNPLIFSQSRINSDVNNDGVIDVIDAYLVRNKLMGTHTSTPLNDKVYLVL